MIQINSDNTKIANWLSIALAQRKRQRELFVKQYGPTSAAVKEADSELAEIQAAIMQAQHTPTQLEQEINKRSR